MYMHICVVVAMLCGLCLVNKVEYLYCLFFPPKIQIETLMRNQTLYYLDQHVLAIKVYFHIAKSTLKISGLRCSNSQVFFFFILFKFSSLSFPLT